jgi:hypothetical protein
VKKEKTTKIIQKIPKRLNNSKKNPRRNTNNNAEKYTNNEKLPA